MKSLVSGIASWKPTSSTALNKACRMLLLSAPAIGVTELAVRILDRNQLQPSMQQLERAIAIPCNFLAWATCETGKFLMFPLQGNQFRFSCLEVAPPIIATIMIIYFFSRAREAPRRHTAPFVRPAPMRVHAPLPPIAPIPPPTFPISTTSILMNRAPKSPSTASRTN